MFRKIISIVLITTILIVPLTLQFWIKVNKLKCVSNQGSCIDDVKNQLNLNLGLSYAKAKKNTIKYLKSNHLIGSFSVSYKIPGILYVDLITVEPRYAILDKTTNIYYLISDQGISVRKIDKTDLPRIEVSSFDIKDGQEVDAKTLNLLKLVEGSFLIFQKNVGIVNGDTLTVEVNPDLQVLFPVDKDPNLLLGALRLIYYKIQSDIDKYREIDLRYTNPILR